MARTATRGVIGVTVGCAFIVTGCGTEGPAHSDDPSPVLLVRGEADDGQFSAVLKGTLRISDANCFTLDEKILVADYGSRVLNDGSGIRLSDGSEVKVGEQLSGGGGEVQDMRASRGVTGWENCVEDGTAPTFAMFHP